jgi:DNA-binding beta-propeller fold protein YncE
MRPVVRHVLCLMMPWAVLALLGLTGATAATGTADGAVHSTRPPVTVYVASSVSGNVTAIRAGHTAGLTISTGGAHCLAATPNGKTVYVTTDDGVVPINTATNTAGRAFQGGGPDLVAGPQGYTLYGVGFGGSVTFVRVATNKPEGTTINTGVSPDGLARIAITPNGSTLYLADFFGDTVVPVNTATHTVGTPITVAADPDAIAVTPNGKTLYVASGGSGSGAVTPINTATNTAGPAISVPPNPGALLITPNGKTVYVASSGSLTPISTATNTAGQPIPGVGVYGQGLAMAITPNGNTLLVATGSHSVTPVNTATNTPGQPIHVRAGPTQIAITPNGKTAYVLNWGTRDVFGHTVTPIQIATLQAGRPISVGLAPIDLVITP